MIIKITPVMIPNMDFGPVISFIGFPAIISNVQMNIIPRMPRIIKIIPFAFIYLTPFEKTTSVIGKSGYAIRYLPAYCLYLNDTTNKYFFNKIINFNSLVLSIYKSIDKLN